MKKLLIASALVAAGSLCLQDISTGHGGTYRGPGDTVPPGGGGGGGAPGAPGSGGPATPGPGGPGTPGPATPGGPVGSGPAAPTTSGGGDSGPDLTIWQYWWGFNREPYLNLKSHIHAGNVVTGSDDFFLGRGEKAQSRDSLRPSESMIREKVVPALVKALQNEQSNDIISGCLVALAKIGDAKDESGQSKMAQHIMSRLTDGSQEIQETSAVALGILANEANIGLLTALLNNDGSTLRNMKVLFNGAVPDRTRAFAAYGLGLIGYKASPEGRQAVVDALIAMLEGEAKQMGQRDIPVACLTALGLTALPIDPTAAPGRHLQEDAQARAGHQPPGADPVVDELLRERDRQPVPHPGAGPDRGRAPAVRRGQRLVAAHGGRHALPRGHQPSLEGREGDPAELHPRPRSDR